jgi:catechol 2,3-dioxygenase-like lactoylglutathione lyase family enzyme
MLALKTVIRCASFEASRRFYRDVLGLVERTQWEDDSGPGCIFEVAPGGLIEIQAMNPRDPRFAEAFLRPVANDKIDVQLRVSSLDDEVRRLRERWPFDGPVDLPWGQRCIRLRDPDGTLIALYENVAAIE